MGRSEANTGGGRVETTTAHDGDTPAGRFAACGVSTVASAGVGSPAGASTGIGAEASEAARAALCFSTLSSRRCARDDGAAVELDADVCLVAQVVDLCSFLAGAARGEEPHGIASGTTSRRPGIVPVIATTWRKPRRTNVSVATMRKSAACRCAAISPRSARLVARRFGIVPHVAFADTPGERESSI